MLGMLTLSMADDTLLRTWAALDDPEHYRDISTRAWLLGPSKTAQMQTAYLLKA